MDLTNLFKSKKVEQLETEVSTLSKDIQQYQEEIKALTSYVQQTIRVNNNINNKTAYYPDWSSTDYVSQFTSNDNIFSVFTKVAETTSLIPIYVGVIEDEKKAKRLKDLTHREFYTAKGIYDIASIQKKALVDAPDNDPLLKLLENPNPNFSKAEFYQSVYLSYLFKEVFIYKDRILEGANAGITKELHILPSQNVNIIASSTFPHSVFYYEFKVYGEVVLTIMPEDMIHIKRQNPFAAAGTVESLRGLSILDIAKKLITRMNAEDDAATSQMQNGGLPGVIFDKAIPFDARGQTELDGVRKKFYDFINSKDNKGSPYWAAGELGYITTGLKLADLELAEMSKRDFKRLCNLLKISDFLFNNDAKYDNAEQYIKQMYTNACLPLAFLIRDKFNQSFANDFGKDKKRLIYCDITAITEIQDDIKEWASSVSQLPAAPSVNEQRAVLNYEPFEGDEYDKPLIKQGYLFIEDLSGDNIDPNLLLP